MSDFSQAYAERLARRGSREAQNRLAPREHAEYARSQVRDNTGQWGPAVGGLTALAYALAGEPVWQTAKTWAKYQENPEAHMESIAEVPAYFMSKMTPRPLGQWILDQAPVLSLDPQLMSDFDLRNTMPEVAGGSLRGYLEGVDDYSVKTGHPLGALSRYLLQRTR